MKQVRFKRAYGLWNDGEIAGFEDDVASGYVRTGIASLVDESKAGPVPVEFVQSSEAATEPGIPSPLASKPDRSKSKKEAPSEDPPAKE